jgi:hypothetical protein
MPVLYAWQGFLGKERTQCAIHVDLASMVIDVVVDNKADSATRVRLLKIKTAIGRTLSDVEDMKRHMLSNFSSSTPVAFLDNANNMIRGPHLPPSAFVATPNILTIIVSHNDVNTRELAYHEYYGELITEIKVGSLYNSTSNQYSYLYIDIKTLEAAVFMEPEWQTPYEFQIEDGNDALRTRLLRGGLEFKSFQWNTTTNIRTVELVDGNDHSITIKGLAF